MSSIERRDIVTERNGGWWFCRGTGALLAVVLLSGCGKTLDTEYGQRSGAGASKSVNGTAVLADMFEEADHTVFSWGMLSPRVFDRTDCIVWFPDDFGMPSQDVRWWLEDWLDAKPGRTLIYVGRGYDAEALFWKKTAAAPDASKSEANQRRAEQTAADGALAAEVAAIPNDDSCDWFRVRQAKAPIAVRSLQGDPSWTRDVDPAKLEIQLHAHIEPVDAAETLLRSGEEVLVSRQAWGKSQLIVVNNGSFLLNLPLVNHEHRKLAGCLIDEIGPAGKRVCFLESGSGGPPIQSIDADASTPMGLKLFCVWPTNWIMIHVAIAGILFCFARLPIFGRPRRRGDAFVPDFGKHIVALGELLSRSRDDDYARGRLRQYREQKEEAIY